MLSLIKSHIFNFKYDVNFYNNLGIISIHKNIFCGLVIGPTLLIFFLC